MQLRIIPLFYHHCYFSLLLLSGCLAICNPEANRIRIIMNSVKKTNFTKDNSLALNSTQKILQSARTYLSLSALLEHTS